jgi:hypothetical protein
MVVGCVVARLLFDVMCLAGNLGMAAAELNIGLVACIPRMAWHGIHKLHTWDLRQHSTEQPCCCLVQLASQLEHGW